MRACSGVKWNMSACFLGGTEIPFDAAVIERCSRSERLKDSGSIFFFESQTDWLGPLSSHNNDPGVRPMLGPVV